MTTQRVWRAALVSALGFVVVGCGTQDPPPRTEQGATALVIGNRSNMPVPGLVQAAEDALETAIDRGDELIIISVAGEPKVDAKTNLGCPHSTTEACKEWVTLRLTQIPAVVRLYPAETPEASLWNAISLARDNIAAVTGPKQIITVDSGLDTLGEMSLTDLGVLLPADHVAFGQALVDNGFAPDLTGITVLMTGLGQTAQPQPALESPDRAALTDLWTSVLAAAGAEQVTVATDSLPGASPAADLPPVTVAAHAPSVAPPDPCRAQFRFNESDLGFNADQATFRDRNRAVDALTALATALKATGVNVVLTGTTAYRETDAANPLSNARAAAVKEILVGLGVPASRIITQGVGVAWDGYRDPEGDPRAEITMRLVLADPTCPR